MTDFLHKRSNNLCILNGTKPQRQFSWQRKVSCNMAVYNGKSDLCSIWIMDSDNCKDLLVSEDDRKWHYFILTSVSIFFGGLFVILCGRLLVRLCESRATKTSRVTPPNSAKSRKSASKNNRTAHNTDEDEGGFYVSIKEGAGSLINVKTLKGRVMVSK